MGVPPQRKLFLTLRCVIPVLLGLHASSAQAEGRVLLNVTKGGAIIFDQNVFKDLNTNFSRPDFCKIQVSQDGTYQRVGRVKPEVFNCKHLHSGTVKYFHSGSPLLESDVVKLKVFHISEDQTITEDVFINISIYDNDHRLISQGKQAVEVGSFMGRSPPISEENVQFGHGTTNASCRVTYLRKASAWPVIGHLLRDDGVSTISLDDFELPCNELTSRSILYEHLVPPSPDVDYVPLEVQADTPYSDDSAAMDEPLTERFFLPVRVARGLPNQAPRASFLGAYVMDVDEFVLATVIPGVLSATDAETPVGQLVFTISKPPSEGYFVHLSDHTEPIRSFRQEEMDAGMIAYWPPSVSYATKRIYEVEFTVQDLHFTSSTPIVLHIAVRPSETNAPRVSISTALSLLEGQSRLVGSEHLHIVDNDNDLATVRLYVIGGLHHGQLLVDGRLAVIFTPLDIAAGRVRYTHDDSNSARDFVQLRITDGRHAVRTKLFINILPKDDTPPFIVRNTEIEVMEGDIARITALSLSASDDDSDIAKIRYIISKPPNGGDLLRKINPKESGVTTRKFSNRDLLNGYVYYKHFGGEVFDDAFEFSLSDDNRDIPNESHGHVFRIRIVPVDDTPPEEALGTNRSVNVLETDLKILTTSVLHYTDTETEDNKIVFSMSSPPLFLQGGNGHAGKIVSTKGLQILAKNSSLPMLTTFTQRDIKYGMVAYMPPEEDIGVLPQHVHFALVVADEAGNELPFQEVNITILPVDNKAPVVRHRPLKVHEGSFVVITASDLQVTDEDTPANTIRLNVTRKPAFGRVTTKTKAPFMDDSFSLNDVALGNVRYVHDGSEESASDEFELSISDGYQSTTVTYKVQVAAVNDEKPQFSHGLKNHLKMLEGSFAIVTSENLAASDKDTDSALLQFVVLTPGNYGSLYLDKKQPAASFTQADVSSGRVAYRTLQPEIGQHSVQDTLTLGVSDLELKVYVNSDLPTMQLHFTVLPVNSQRPRLLGGGNVIAVMEGSRARISENSLLPEDTDSSVSELTYVVQRSPMFGYFESDGYAPGSEQSLQGHQLKSFSHTDLSSGAIWYVQSNHSGLEPTEDTAQVLVTDGVHNSSSATLRISIRGVNDEPPSIFARNMNISEGGVVVLHDIMVVDQDIPKDKLQMSVGTLPLHGRLTLTMVTNDGRTVELPIQRPFDPAELGTLLKLTYRHDGSEKFSDRMVLEVTDGVHRTEHQVNVTVSPVNDAVPEVVKNAGVLLYYNETAVISSVLLVARDEDNRDNEVFYVLVRIPTRGDMELKTKESMRGSDDVWQRMNVGDRFSQADVNHNRVRYRNLRVSTADKTADVFEFELTDGTNKRWPAESFEIEVRKSRVLPIVVASIGRPLWVGRGERAPVTTQELNAQDSSDMYGGLIYVVRMAPVHGRLERAERLPKGDAFAIAHSFTQLDLASGRITYVHDGHSNETSDTVEFMVKSEASSLAGGQTSSSPKARLAIKIVPVDNELPSIFVHGPALMNSSSAPLSDFISVQDSDTDSRNVTITIASIPKHGKVTIDDRAVGAFTLDDLKKKRPIYSRSTLAAFPDLLIIQVSDGKHTGHRVNGKTQFETVLKITKAVNDVNSAHTLARCSDVTVLSPQSLELLSSGRQGFVISTANVRLPRQCDSSAVALSLMSPPQHGTLMKADKAHLWKGTLAHAELAKGMLYVLNTSNASVQNDSLSFKLRIGDKLQDTVHTIVLSWSVVEFARSDTKVCENNGSVSIRIKRRGNLDGTAFVNVVVQEQTAKVNEDFVLSRVQQLQLEPGMEEISYVMTILSDNLIESTEHFTLSLKTPTNCILGDISSTAIHIADVQKGACIMPPAANTDVSPRSPPGGWSPPSFSTARGVSSASALGDEPQGGHMKAADSLLSGEVKAGFSRAASSPVSSGLLLSVHGMGEVKPRHRSEKSGVEKVRNKTTKA